MPSAKIPSQNNGEERNITSGTGNGAAREALAVLPGLESDSVFAMADRNIL
jgi:hypothetical protein